MTIPTYTHTPERVGIYAPGHDARWRVHPAGSSTLIAHGLSTYQDARDIAEEWMEKFYESNEYHPLEPVIEKSYYCVCSAETHERGERKFLDLPDPQPKPERGGELWYDDTPGNRAAMDADGVEYQVIRSKSLGGRYLKPV